MHWRTVVIILFILVVYAVIGGVIFHYIETQHEQQMREIAHQRIQTFLDDRPCLNLTTILAVSKLLSSAKAAGLQSIPGTNNLTYITNWDLTSSIFLAFQIIGSVGYGNAPPKTTGGRIFCMFFALFGIPLLLVSGLGIAYRMIDGADKLRRICIRNAGPKDAVKIHIIRTAILFVFTIGLLVLIPAAILTATEKKWTYGDAIYFCFTSVLTIGFGDFVPGSDWSTELRNLYRLGVGFWLIISLLIFVGLWSSVAIAISSSKEMQEPLPDDLPSIPSLDRIGSIRRKTDDVPNIVYVPPAERTSKLFASAMPVTFNNPPNPYVVNPGPLYHLPVAQGDVTQVEIRY